MPQRKIHSVNKALTEEERVRHRAIREQIEQEKPELITRGRRAKARHIRLKEAITALKMTREALGLSLDVHFVSSLPVMQRTACKAWVDTRPVQMAWAESSTMPAHDVVDDVCD